MLEGELEDISPADTAEVDFLCGAVGGAAEHKELWAQRSQLKLGQLYHETNICN